MMSFINLKFFPQCVSVIGLPAIWWIHCGIALLMCITAIFIIPNTQGKTLTELSEMYSSKESVESDRFSTLMFQNNLENFVKAYPDARNSVK